jgi:hypothetical protein
MSLKEARKIKALIPAPGWRTLCCFIDEGKAVFEELPVIGWGLIDHGEDDDIQLFFYDEAEGATYASEYSAFLLGGLVEAVAPGTDIDAVCKNKLEERVRRRMLKTRKEVTA